MQALAATLPGVHDLLPGYRCVNADSDAHHLTPADVEAIGGNRDLAAAALDFRDCRRGRRERWWQLGATRALVMEPTAVPLADADHRSGPNRQPRRTKTRPPWLYPPRIPTCRVTWGDEVCGKRTGSFCHCWPRVARRTPPCDQ
jgi:hypothetical protein